MKAHPVPFDKNDFDVRYCNCADPENCTTPIPGYACRPRSARTAELQSVTTAEWQALVERAREEGRLAGLIEARSAELHRIDQAGLDAAAWELQRSFGREGSIYGIKACEEIARLAVATYQRTVAPTVGARR